MADLSSLIEKLEQATSGSYALDVEIQDWRRAYLQVLLPDHPPAFTTSLDAARSLVPEGWEFSTDGYRRGDGAASVCKYFGGEGRRHFSKSQAGPAVALCLAALKARKEMDHG